MRHRLVIWGIWLLAVIGVVVSIGLIVLALYGIAWLLDGPGWFMRR